MQFTEQELKNYKKVSDLLQRADQNLNMWSIDWRLTDFFADGLNASFTKDELFTLVQLRFEKCFEDAIERNVEKLQREAEAVTEQN